MNRSKSKCCAWTTLVVAMSLVMEAVACQETTPPSSNTADPVDFAADVQPLFAEHCLECHGPELQESNFRLDVRDSAMGPGDIGDQPIVPGDAPSSALIRYVSGADEYLQMPPSGEGEPLTPSQVETLRRWINEGANWPDALAGDPMKTVAGSWWSLQPIRSPTPGQPQPGENEIDWFIKRRLKERGLALSTPANRRTQIRRLYLDLHGLPPTPAQVQTFLSNSSGDAWEQVVDEVLSSERYGEAWARHWLDVVRFGESTGFEVNRDRSNAYYYRDYVIESLNTDKPYRDFIIEQIAGDGVGVDAATGFLVAGPYDMVKSPDINLTLMQRQDELADIVNTTGMTFLALTVGCARCHNHKFDPITQNDYFALQAVFAGVQHGERRMVSAADAQVRANLELTKQQIAQTESEIAQWRESVKQEDDTELFSKLPPVNARLNEENFSPVVTSRVRMTIRATNRSEPCIDEFEVFSAETGVNVALSSEGAVASSSGDYVGNPIHQLEHVNDGQYGNSFSWISNAVGTGWIQIDLKQPVSVNRILWGRDRNGEFSDRLPTSYEIAVLTTDDRWTVVASSDRRQPYVENGNEPEDAFVSRLPAEESRQARKKLDELAHLRQRLAEQEEAIPLGYVGTFSPPPTIHRLFRGDPMSPREEVAPGGIECVGPLELTSSDVEQQRRLALAHWIASPDNPLTARVIVNRVWHYHFGRGIVETPSDFGKNGATPSHPDLLDYLATELIRHGWSLKWLHKTIVMSATYRQSSHPNSESLAVDSESRWLWRFPPRRLTAEAIRDCVLHVSGKLNHAGGGPGFLLFQIDRENVHHYFPLQKFGPEHFRRMIYATKIRQEQDDVFGVFDCPDGGQAIARRARSTTPLQALNLLNSQFMLEQADYFAERLRGKAGDDADAQIRLAFEWAYGRPAEPSELQDSVEFAATHGLAAFCRAILNSNEFLFLN